MNASVSVFVCGVVLTAALVGLGCGKKTDVGEPCAIPGFPADTSSIQGYAGPSAECESNICLKPASHAEQAPDTGATCTAACSSDDDCEVGQSRDPSNAVDRRCRNGFVCGVPFEVGAFACRRMCICKDFLPAGRMAPALGCTRE